MVLELSSKFSELKVIIECSNKCLISPILSSTLSDGAFTEFSNLLGIAGSFRESLGVTVISIVAPVFKFGFGPFQTVFRLT